MALDLNVQTRLEHARILRESGRLTLSTEDLIELRQVCEYAELIGDLVVDHVLWI